MSETLVKNRVLLLVCTAILSLLLIIPASRVNINGSGVSFTLNDSKVHKDYLSFVESFGTDDYLILAVKNSFEISDLKLSARVDNVHQELLGMDVVLEVIDLGTMASSEFINRGIGSDFWNTASFSKARRIIPGFGRLISQDMKTVAFIVKINNENTNGFQLEKQLNRMKQILVKNFPEHPHCYAAGIPVIRAAFERYNLQSALIFGGMGLFFGILIAFYLFKTPWISVMVLFSSVVSLAWAGGIMGLLGIDLNLATGLSFGFILVVSTTTAFHIASAYFQRLKTDPEGQALLKTLQTVLPACFMCALTTATGFLSLVVSTIPMVRQAGIIISIGVMLAFFLTLIITVFFLPIFFKDQKSNSPKPAGDFLEKFIKTGLLTGINNPLFSVCLGLAFIVTLAWAIPEIRAVKHLSHDAIKNTREATDLEYIEQHISSGTSLSVILQPIDEAFRTRKFWYDLVEYEKNLSAIPGIQGVESLTPLIFRMALKFGQAGIKPEKIFDQIQHRSGENDVLRMYYNPDTKKMRLIVHIQNQTSDQIETIISMVEEKNSQAFANNVQATLSGQLLLLRSQTTDLVASQVKTIILALFVITILMMIQLKSVVLGTLSLIPNLFPLVTIFGIMGWFHIPLDPLTIFAAIISFGLSVDDSIHYLTHLKTEMGGKKNNPTIHECLKAAYFRNARALVSTTAVLFFASLGLLFSSFGHVFSLGILISAASMAALFGDLVFMPALVLIVKPLNVLLSKKLQEPVS